LTIPPVKVLFRRKGFVFPPSAENDASSSGIHLLPDAWVHSLHAITHLIEKQCMQFHVREYTDIIATSTAFFYIR
jgi:hypothetical protein